MGKHHSSGAALSLVPTALVPKLATTLSLYSVNKYTLFTSTGKDHKSVASIGMSDNAVTDE